MFDLIWKKATEQQDASLKLEGQIKSINSDFRNFKDRIELEREQLIREMLFSVHQEWSIQQKNKMEVLKQEISELATAGFKQHEHVIQAFKGQIVEAQEEIIKSEEENKKMIRRI